MSVKYIKENYPETYPTMDEEALRWIFKNKNILREKFSKRFPKSPFLFVVQIKTERGTVLVNDEAEVKRVDKVAYLSWKTLRQLGCPTSF
ncbi:MAG: hypothetical protein WC346_18095 [Methanogenium sp.]|jgi:hypothetical protein